MLLPSIKITIMTKNLKMISEDVPHLKSPVKIIANQGRALRTTFYSIDLETRILELGPNFINLVLKTLKVKSMVWITLIAKRPVTLTTATPNQ